MVLFYVSDIFFVNSTKEFVDITTLIKIRVTLGKRGSSPTGKFPYNSPITVTDIFMTTRLMQMNGIVNNSQHYALAISSRKSRKVFPISSCLLRHLQW